MHYQHTRQQSAGFLRIAIALMGQQEASFHPASYALWYECAAGVNASLSHALEQRIAMNSPLTDTDVWRDFYVGGTAEGDAGEGHREPLK